MKPDPIRRPPSMPLVPPFLIAGSAPIEEPRTRDRYIAGLALAHGRILHEFGASAPA